MGETITRRAALARLSGGVAVATVRATALGGAAGALAAGCVPCPLPVRTPFTAPPPAPAQASMPTRFVDLAALAARVPAADVAGAPAPLLGSVFLGAFESAMHRRWDGTRLDMIAATGHDVLAESDYQRLLTVGMHGCRDAARWPLIGRRRFDLARFLPMVRAASRAPVTVAWDLCHYGWPDDVDVFSSAFVRAFARYARWIAEVLDGEAQAVWISPVNEPSFLAWAAGDEQLMFPYGIGRGLEMKKNLVRAICAASEAILSACPRARLLHCDPLIHLVARTPDAEPAVAAYRAAQFDAWTWIAGRAAPELGGDPRFLDVVAVNYYRNNQAFEDGTFIAGDDPAYRPLSLLLLEVWERFRRPMIIGETGIEGALRPAWARYVAGEAGQAMAAGCALDAVCWSPVLDHPGWDDARHCENGLWDYPEGAGRSLYAPLAQTLAELAGPLDRLRAAAARQAQVAPPG